MFNWVSFFSELFTWAQRDVVTGSLPRSASRWSEVTQSSNTTLAQRLRISAVNCGDFRQIGPCQGGSKAAFCCLLFQEAKSPGSGVWGMLSSVESEYPESFWARGTRVSACHPSALQD